MSVPRRLLTALAAVCSAGSITAASAQAPASCTAQSIPTKLDYVVLASFADSGHFLGMSNYNAKSFRSR